MPELSVAIVGGLHADARRAAVQHLLTAVPGSVALHHDLATAAAGTVVRTVRDRTGILSTGEAPLVNDCACCALREDLVPELERLADAGLTRLAVVELWESVEPKAMAEVVAASGLRLTGVITAVDTSASTSSSRTRPPRSGAPSPSPSCSCSGRCRGRRTSGSKSATSTR